MITKLPRELCEAVGMKVLTKFGIDEKTFTWGAKYASVDVSRMKRPQLDELEKVFAPHAKTRRGAATMLADVKRWRSVLDGDSGARPRTVQQFSSMVTRYLSKVPGHRVYCHDARRQADLAAYVNRVAYSPARTQNGQRYPAYCQVQLVYWEFKQRCGLTVTFYDENCLGMNVVEALAAKGIVAETAELRAKYLEEKAKFFALHDCVGLQLEATGVGTDDVDGNGDREDDYWRRWWRTTSSIVLDKAGTPAKVVVDVFREEPESAGSRRVDGVHVDTLFWTTAASGEELDEEVESYSSDDYDDDSADDSEIEVPIRPLLAVFDLKRHLRLRVHVGSVEVHVYDRELGKDLVIPTDVRALVDMLVTQQADFKDVVAGKGGGATVLCCGAPGVGKTLTAEVYSETAERPLYSVQCSQLGLTPEALEESLAKVFARAERWNAILLLDEADVYIRERGEDVQQNAIVGVFLRVLEYYAGTLFMTTNRGDTVDDAVASRCVARIDYGMPSVEEQREIWGILTRVSGTKISKAAIDRAVAAFPDQSGRDIKNLIKLARMRAAATGKEVDVEAVKFAKKFKPTRGQR